MANLELTEADIAEILGEYTPRARLLILYLLKRVSHVEKLEQRVADLEAHLSKKWIHSYQRGYRRILNEGCAFHGNVSMGKRRGETESQWLLSQSRRGPVFLSDPQAHFHNA